jgi:hypothetical protein
MDTERYRTTPVVVKNPKTGQVIKTTEKVFYSIYRDKGFVAVNRETAGDPPVVKTGNGSKRKTERSTTIAGSAAEVAAGLGLDDKATPKKTSMAMDNETETVDDEDANQ